MSAKQIHELPAVETVDATDQVLLSTATGQLTRRVAAGTLARVAIDQLEALPATEALGADDGLVVTTAADGSLRRATVDAIAHRPIVGGSPRPLRDKLADQVSIKDFGARSDGTEDCSPILVRALDAGHRAIFFPAGNYRFDSKVVLPAGTTLEGAGPHAVEIDARGEYWVELRRNTSPGFTADWCRCQISGFSVAMAQGGILGHGHEIRISNMRFRQGVAGAWCIELHASNECLIANISGGYGGGENAYDLHANGIRVYATDAADESSVNYGDGTIQEVSLKGDRPGWVGIKLEHLSTNQSLGSINNMLLSRVQCQAPFADSASPDYVRAGSVGAYVGSKGVALHRVQRSTFITVDVEGNEVGFAVSGAEYGTTGTAVNLGSTATRRNVFIGCQAFNTATPWQDTNATLDGSVGQNTFLAGQEHGPLQPTGFANGDPVDQNDQKTFAGRRSSYDMMLPGGLWFSRPGNSAAKAALRLTDNEHLLLVADYQEPPVNPSSPDQTLTPAGMAALATSAGVRADWALANGMPKNLFPRKALAIDVASSNNEAKIYRPRGYNVTGWDASTQQWNANEESRITIGNGPGFQINDGATAVTIGPLHRVQVQDPFYLREVATGESLPVQNFTNQPATIVNVQEKTHLSNNGPNTWIGPGLYAHVRDNASTGRRWVPVMAKPGFMTAQLNRGGATYPITRDDLGTIKSYNGGAGVGCTLTLPNNLLFDKELHNTSTTGYSSAAWFDILRTDSDPLTIDCTAAGLYVVVDGIASDQAVVALPAYSGVVRVYYVQTAANVATVYFMGLRAPHVGQSQSVAPGAALAVTADHMAKGTLVLNPIASMALQFGTGLVPTGFGTAKLVVVNKHATNTVDIAAGAGMTLNAPTSGVRLKQNCPVTVHLVGTEIFIEGETTTGA